MLDLRSVFEVRNDKFGIFLSETLRVLSVALRHSCCAETRRGGAEERGGAFDIRLETADC